MPELFSGKLPNRLLLKGRANNGILFIVAIMATLTSFAFVLMGGVLPVAPEASVEAPKNTGEQEIQFEQNADPGKKNLQLQTFTVKNTCEDKLAVDFLIDVSGSMAFGNKQVNEMNALNSFADRMSDTSVIGIQIFSDPTNVREIIPLSLFKDVKNEVRATINNLPASGATSTRSAFSLAKLKLTEAITKNRYPGYNYSLVFLSDGIPETIMFESEKNSTNCLATSPDPINIGATRCFARAQDPRTPTNIPEEIKLQGVDIYSIAITDPKDQPMKTELLQLLQDVSSDPDSTYFYESVDGNDLTTILDYVLKSICEAQ
ncbi:MAG TPA: VWA domain-containing protein [Candidatus Limnocylindrales bacterium]|nr:VWA domain-containing protein [Candidatus Limnocylindrales bacterium]